MPFRYSMFAETVVAMRDKGELGTISHGILRFNQPGIQRYRDLGSPWMLSKADAGGGALLNLGIHGFDICRYLTGEEPRVVSAVTSHAIHNQEIEDYAHVTLRTPSGVIFLVEASYTFPGTGGDQERKISAEKASCGRRPGRRGRADHRPGSQRDAQGTRRLSERLAEGRQRMSGPNRPGRAPPTTARDCARAVSLIFDAYRMAGEKIVPDAFVGMDDTFIDEFFFLFSWRIALEVGRWDRPAPGESIVRNSLSGGLSCALDYVHLY